jgi:N,N'-diacetyllegionaminate synthase
MIGKSSKDVYIIAEAGVNHNGDMGLARELIAVAAESGVNAIKFQTFNTDLLTTKNAPKADYQKRNADPLETQRKMLRKLELSHSNHILLLEECRQKGIEFLSTAFDLESIRFLSSIGLNKFKVPSGEITNLPYLRLIGSLGFPLIVSTGMCTLNEVESAINVLLMSGMRKSEITLLHCTSDYPANMKDVNLKAMQTLNSFFDINVGYSDHTMGIEVPIAAVAMGAGLIEKHFTLSRNLPGPDHGSSLEPKELVSMVHAIRSIELALGDGVKMPTKEELSNLRVVRKSIVASTHIKKGETFSPDNLTTKRPASGVSPMFWDKIIGTVAMRNYEPDDQIEI